ncbi:MAG: Sec-independent protein translocase subunit TatB [Betaproteobacteria bacterium]|nr:Sec-independent protein translocase subunit TatB [Betaproteobacteria bacterium]MBI2958931.1 Sec-independent protein translocase subunit TatB [Betaproteobacteria bacterium]
MFDIGFSEMLLIGVVALVVIGPERLPKVARTMGHLFARLQRYVNEVKADINREIELDELRKFKSEFEQAAHSVESAVRSEAESVESGLNAIAGELEGSPPATSPPAPPAAARAAESPPAEPVQADLFASGVNAAPSLPEQPPAVAGAAAKPNTGA